MESSSTKFFGNFPRLAFKEKLFPFDLAKRRQYCLNELLLRHHE